MRLSKRKKKNGSSNAKRGGDNMGRAQFFRTGIYWIESDFLPGERIWEAALLEWGY